MAVYHVAGCITREALSGRPWVSAPKKCTTLGWPPRYFLFDANQSSVLGRRPDCAQISFHETDRLSDPIDRRLRRRRRARFPSRRLYDATPSNVACDLSAIRTPVLRFVVRLRFSPERRSVYVFILPFVDNCKRIA